MSEDTWGFTVKCPGCGEPVRIEMGDNLHLCHSDDRAGACVTNSIGALLCRLRLHRYSGPTMPSGVRHCFRCGKRWPA